MGHQPKKIFEFGPYQLDAAERLLLRHREVVPLQPKVFDLLLALVERHGHLLEKDELMSAVWPDTFVSEANLANNISILRKTLGENGQQFIETAPKRGYRFVAAVRELNNGSNEPDIIDNSQTPTIAAEKEEMVTAMTTRQSIPIGEPPARELASPKTWIIGGPRLAPLFVILLLIGVAGSIVFWRLMRRPVAPNAVVKSIAVLPFKSLDPNERDEALGLKLADALILRLGRLRQIVVRPTRAVQRYYGANTLDPLEAGREQEVDAVLDGSFQRAGERLRVTARMLRVSDGRQLWAGAFDERVDGDPFTLQDALSANVTQAIAPHLAGEELRLMQRHGTNDAQAYQAYELGRFYWNRRTPEAMKKARDYFQQAINRDSNYAMAHAGLANVWITLSDYEVTPAREAYPKAKEAAEKALALDGTLADAQTALAMASASYDWEWDVADASFKRAIALDPNYATAHQWYAEYLAAMDRRVEALDQIHRAEELDPASVIIRADEAWILYFAHDYDRAIAKSEQAIGMDAHFGEVYYYLAAAYEQKGMYREAMGAFQKHAELMGYNTPRGEAIRTSAILKAEDFWRKRASIERLPGTGSASEGQLAEALAQLGEIDEAVALLERRFAAHGYQIMYLKVHPNFDRLRSDPRFVKLMRSIRLEP
jgi:DNA-binding winged helix-turn-helix (wHTH) protein/TolB-like protein/Tfp pilus assembly protein PilF